MPIWIWYRKKETAREYSCITPVILNLKQLVFFFWEHLDSPQNIQLRILKQLAKWTTIEKFIHLHSERTHTPSVSDDSSMMANPYYRCNTIFLLCYWELEGNENCSKNILGKVVSGWRVRNMSQWDVIGKRDPQLPQMFYPVANTSTTLMPGDVIAARCTMVKKYITIFHWGHSIP